MACKLSRPTPQALWDRIAGMFQANVLGGGTLIPDSNEWYVVANDYAAHEAFYSIAEAQWKEQDPRTACCDNLVEMAARLGVYPRPATYAQGYVRLTGTSGVQMPTSLDMSFGTGIYRQAPGVSLPASFPTSGELILRVSAIEPGADGNGGSPISQTGTLITPATGIDRDVTVYGGRFCGGQDAEDCEAFRLRYLERLQYAPRWDYRYIKQKLLEWPCLTRICLRTCDCCVERGSFRAFLFFDGTFEYGVPPDSVVQEVQDWFFGNPQGFGMGQAEWGMIGQLYAAQTIKLDIQITNLPCSSPGAAAEIKSRIESMLLDACPGTRVCRRSIDAIIIQVLGTQDCDYEVYFRAAGQSLWTCDDYCPECDVLPVPGQITIKGGAFA